MRPRATTRTVMNLAVLLALGCAAVGFDPAIRVAESAELEPVGETTPAEAQRTEAGSAPAESE